jgi:hypothetical protein
VDSHEIDRVGRDTIGGHAQIALVFPILVVNQDNHLALADLIKGALNAT